MRSLVFIGCVLFSLTGFAMPQEIMLVRHADKATKDAGHFVDPTGYLRAINFANYYQRAHYPTPDYIFITKSEGKGRFEHSSRELQTIAPLMNTFETKGDNVPVEFPYAPKNYKKLAKEILTNPKYNGKFILICWEHGRIPQFAHALGVKLQPKKWPGVDFDTVYLLNYKSDKHPSLTVLNHQYPTPAVKGWGAFSASS